MRMMLQALTFSPCGSDDHGTPDVGCVIYCKAFITIVLRFVNSVASAGLLFFFLFAFLLFLPAIFLASASSGSCSSVDYFGEFWVVHNILQQC